MPKSTPYEWGNPDADICFLAEAPGGAEIKARKPLVGPAGRVFDRALKYAGISRHDTYILNVFPFRVYKKTKNSQQLFHSETDELLWSPGKGFSDAGERYSEETHSRIAKAKMKVVIPMGNPALDFLTMKKGILKWRGSILEAPSYPQFTVLPTIHPSGVLRGQDTWLHMIVADLKRARGIARGEIGGVPIRELIIRPSLTEIREYLASCHAHKICAYDTEIYNHQVSCISFSYNPMSAICIPFVDDYGQHYWSEEEELATWDIINAILANHKIIKVNQNIIFDNWIMARQNIQVNGVIECIMCAQHIMMPDHPKGLDFIASIHTLEHYYKDEGKVWKKGWVDFDSDEYFYYNCKDAAVALEAWYTLKEDMLREGYWDTYRHTMDMFPPLLYMMLKGIKIDVDRLNTTHADVNKKIEGIEVKLHGVSDYAFNPGSQAQVAAYFYEHKGIKPYTSLKTGEKTVDEKALQRIANRYDLEEARLVLQFRHYSKLKSTYLDIDLDDDNRLRCSYNPRGTNTGRLSSAATIFDTGLNMQNLDPVLKDFLVVDGD